MKYAFVTGGTRGIGLAVCALLSERGYTVSALYSCDEESARRARGLCPSVAFLRGDAGREEDVIRAMGTLPALDLLVNNAGRSLFRQVQDTTAEEWEAIMRTNAGGVFLCTKHAVKKFLARGSGAIVNISSVWGQTGGSCESAYSASKGAVEAFTKATAKELAPSRITVNCVSPGMISTDMNARLTREERDAVTDGIPLGREGTAEEVARAVLFLAEHPYITGEILKVNGGMYI